MVCTTDTTIPSPELLRELDPDLQKEWKRVLNAYYWETCSNFKKKHDIPDPSIDPVRIVCNNYFQLD